MKKILIVGANSFIAKVFIKSLAVDSYLVMSVRDDKWQTYEYSSIETIIYFAGIVHHPEITDEYLYDKVNAIIPYEMAKLAARQGVHRFIYISSVAVYGIGPLYGNKNIINRQTPLIPTSLYGKSKLKGENLLNSVKGLIVQIVRLPNVYGESCPGTFYYRIKTLATFKCLPSCGTNYKFSLISVDNVAKALKRLLQLDHAGIFIPQDTPALSIMERIERMARENNIHQIYINVRPLLWVLNKVLPKKYTDNLYGGFYIDPKDFPVMTD